MFTLAIGITFVFGAIACYAAIVAGARADERSEQYCREHKHEFHGQDKE